MPYLFCFGFIQPLFFFAVPKHSFSYIILSFFIRTFECQNQVFEFTAGSIRRTIIRPPCCFLWLERNSLIYFILCAHYTEFISSATKFVSNIDIIIQIQFIIKCERNEKCVKNKTKFKSNKSDCFYFMNSTV